LNNAKLPAAVVSATRVKSPWISALVTLAVQSTIVLDC